MLIFVLFGCYQHLGGAVHGGSSNYVLQPLPVQAPDSTMAEALVDELLEEDGDTVAVDPTTSGISHIKVSGFPSLMDDIALAIAKSEEIESRRVAAENAADMALETALQVVEPGSALDRSSPKDGHCLFHALRAAGLASFKDVPCQVSIGKLRRRSP